MNPRHLVDTLTASGHIAYQIREDIFREVEESGRNIEEVLVSFGLFDDEPQILATVAHEIGANYLDLSTFQPPPELVQMIPAGMARLHGAVPVAYDELGLQVALIDPLNPQVVEDLRFALDKPIIPVIARSIEVEQLLDQIYSVGESMEEMLGEIGKVGAGGERSPEQEANSAPIIRYVDLVLTQAIKEKASDIHFEPFEHEFRIRYRVDGALYEMAPPPIHLADSIISRIKVMSNMNIAERRVPQDGRIMKTIGTQQVDMRVSSLPIQHGESVVLRVLDRSSVSLELKDLGLPDDVADYVSRTVRKPNGIFICTGPTGAGKTTTLYAALRQVNTVDTKILTAEDPVEYDIEGIIQVPVNEAIKLTFARVLRAFLRQDPDKILVGEMRDQETAEIAIQASLTGHLVFSTLHTNDAPGAVTRLIDMGCEPFLVAASLEGVLGQRLLRRVCKECKTPYEPSDYVLSQLGLTRDDIAGRPFFTGSGCSKCGDTGYRGRVGLYELLDVTDPLRELITERAASIVLRQKAIEMGMVTLREDGLRNIFTGVTTIEEVLKYT